MKKLFYVEFGQPVTLGAYYGSSSIVKPMFVIADNFQEAGEKAINKLIKGETKDESIQVLTSDGSINPILLQESKTPKINSIKLISEEVIF